MIECDLAIKGKYILTINSNMDVVQDGIVLIQKNKIIFVGKIKDLEKKYKVKKIINFGNSIVMPGLINTHTHVGMSYFKGLADDLPLKVWLEEHIWPAESKYVNKDFVKKSSELACLEMIKAGTTCFNDMYFFEEETADVACQIGMRAIVGETVLNFPTPSCKNSDETIKKTLDLIKKYKNNNLIKVSFSPHSVYTCDKKVLCEIKKIAKEKNALIHIHVSETEEEIKNCKKEHGKSPVSYLDEIGLLGKNVIAAHSVWLSDDDLKIYKKRNVKVSHNPVSNMKLASGVALISEMEKEGICVSIGTDGSASNNTLDLFSDIKICALLHKVNKFDPTIVIAKEVVKMVTVNGAKALGLDDKIGSLEKGKLADLIVVDLNKPHLTPLYDIYSHLVYCANSSDVDSVVINGKIIMRNRKVKTINEKEILKEASKFKI